MTHRSVCGLKHLNGKLFIRVGVVQVLDGKVELSPLEEIEVNDDFTTEYADAYKAYHRLYQRLAFKYSKKISTEYQTSSLLDIAEEDDLAELIEAETKMEQCAMAVEVKLLHGDQEGDEG